MPPLTLREPSKSVSSAADSVDRKGSDGSIGEVAIRIKSGSSGKLSIRLGDQVEVLLRSPKGLVKYAGQVVFREGDESEEYFTLRSRTGKLKTFQRSAPAIEALKIHRPSRSAKVTVGRVGRSTRSRRLLRERTYR